MKLLVLADIHGYLGHVSDIECVVDDCDAIVIAGDITDFGGGMQVRHVVSSLSIFAKPLFAVPGNCDLTGVENELQKEHISLHGRHAPLNSIQFIGVGGSLPTGGVNAETGEATFRQLLQQGVSGLVSTDNLVLVTHQPAYGIQLDLRQSGQHAGSRAVREFIEKYQPILAISGHIHESCGVDQLGSTTLLNPGPFREGRYAIVQIDNGQVQVQLCP